jgi:predicted transcriptional regulator
MTKKFTQQQEKKIRAQAKAGWNQERIAKYLHVAKWRVSKFQQKKAIGKRRAKGTSEYWNDVKSTQRQNKTTWKKAIQQTSGTKFWGEKKAARLGKKYKRIEEFWDEMEEEALTQEEKQERWKEMEDEYYFGTPT